MNKKQGFTLIELLAIIVILAVIAVITVPLILNIINDASKNASIDSAHGFKDAVEKYYMKKVVENTENVLPNGYKDVSELPEDFSVSGDAPSDGWVKLKKGIVEKYSLKYKDYVVTMDNNKNVTSEKKDNVYPHVTDEYQEVEYLESTGTQYIDTGYFPDTNCKFVSRYYLPTEEAGNTFGCFEDSDKGFTLYTKGNNSRFGLEHKSATNNYNGFIYNTIATFEYSLDGVFQNGQLIRKISSEYAKMDRTSMYLFGRNANGTASGLIPQRIYNFRVYNNNELILDYVPVIRKSDNKPGMLDLTNLGKNLFDKDNATIVNRYVTSEQKIATSSNARSIIIPCQPNTTYTFSKNQSTRFNLGYTTVEIETGTDVYNNIIDNNATHLTITTGDVAKYLVVYVYNSVYDTNTTLEEILDSAQLEFGAIATPYEPYKKSFYINDGTGEFVTGPEI